MGSETVQEWQAFTQRIQTTLRQVEAHSARLRRTNTGLQIASIVSSAVTTLVAGLTAAQGPIVGQEEAGGGWPALWRLRLALFLPSVWALTSS